MSAPTDKSLRLLFPQWQGGNNPPYHFGSRLLAWLAPEHNGPIEEVPVAEPDESTLPLEDGIVARHALLTQLHAARALIDKHQPDRLVVLGGDCLVDLAPFAYLNERYAGDLAVLWVDAHPDIMTPQQFPHAHAMVLGNLLGNGDPDFVKAVARPVKPGHVMYVGLHDPNEWESAEMLRLGLQNVGPEQLARKGSQPVVEWFKSTGAKHLAIHFDLDALDPAFFRALLFARPDIAAGTFEGVAQGELTIEQVVQLLGDMAEVADVVGLGITEHLPWDALAMKNMLARLPLIGKSA
ncbi:MULTISPECIES: arginase family protein [Pseudomonas]|uniref:Arginase n=1 Tax=Pseudomonas cichorii TaxID=36746 RepID=A0ABQ1DVK0_PSECI|nr:MULTISPECIES: arginase family protein [Pseudomonas]AHF66557.1 putative arginase [Pseudomonas cichorii JBC1]QVE18479.1 arginase family protein [Pseudomonas cichorii]SDP26579.1 arginase [Pseudomonas cichorii]GFM79281.1 arginase [Pseudomonas cichorii]GFM95051.1 arginase [Pseudomonas cichorii]